MDDFLNKALAAQHMARKSGFEHTEAALERIMQQITDHSASSNIGELIPRLNNSGPKQLR